MPNQAPDLPVALAAALTTRRTALIEVWRKQEYENPTTGWGRQEAVETIAYLTSLNIDLRDQCDWLRCQIDELRGLASDTEVCIGDLRRQFEQLRKRLRENIEDLEEEDPDADELRDRG